MDLQQLVREFNKLPRSPRTPSGLADNHWQFAVQHVPLNPPGNLLHLVNPESRYNHSEGPAQNLSSPSATTQADTVLPLLLRAFINSLGMKAHDPSVTQFAPWSWGTNDEQLAIALENRLKAIGVRKELCRVQVGDVEKINIQKEEWAKLLKQLKGMTRPKCTKCKNIPADETHKLQLCGGCKKVHYCSRACQKADWKEHKAVCKHVASQASSSSVSALEYYKTVAPNMPEAKELASDIGLEFGRPQGLSAPLRRLVITGKDTPENIVKLVGPNDEDMVKRIHQDARLAVLLQPPRGSPMYAVSRELDLNCPLWTPREASAAEEREITKIKEMQNIIRRHMGSRSMSSISSKDMKDVLEQNFSGNWVEALQDYQQAINAMDQGVLAH